MSAEQIILFLVLLAVPILPNLWSIWHAFYRDFPSPTEKMIWLGLAVFIPVLGGLAYIIWGRRRGRKPV
ncbi:MAG: PLDc N-terminal domain-containing protein [Thermodesulfobacteriota bacterium]|nr:PLDc N-terminal domain-containing protein [Thermodesulfobacteriota bacterium]